MLAAAAGLYLAFQGLLLSQPPRQSWHQLQAFAFRGGDLLPPRRPHRIRGWSGPRRR